MSDSHRPPDYPLILSWIGQLVFRLVGWKAEGKENLPDLPQFVVVGAHHTSNWDGLVMVTMALIWRLRLNWLGKHTLFRPPLGWLMRLTGGLPINRSTTRNAVEQVIEMFKERDKMVLVIAPEGTRKPVNHWKTGFYYIALGAKVPIVLGYVDYQRKAAGVGRTIYPSGDIETDMAKIRDFYQDITPRHPSRKGEVALPESKNS
jgi:1-acyl-sn-glycerol-3-phosphate acyltransferase